MWDWSLEAEALLRIGHDVVSRVDIWHSGRPSGVSLAAIGGGTTTDVDRPVLRNLTCTLVDPTGQFSRGDVDDLLNPYECEIAPWRGVRVPTTVVGTVGIPNEGFGLQPFGTSGFGGADLQATYTTTYREEMAPQGVFQLTGREVEDSPDGLTIRLTGQDRAMAYQGPMTSALAISGGTPVEEAVALLLSRRNPGVQLSAMVTGHTCGPLVYEPDTDVWAAAQQLAVSVGARLYHDRTGLPVLDPAGPASARPVARYAEGDGLLLSVNRAEDSDTIRNVVVAETPDGLIRVTVEDDDPLSPTYTGGRDGRRVYTLVNQHFSSLTMAEAAARARLAYELGRSETVTFTAVPDPGLDVDEVVTVNRPRAGLTERGLIVATIDLPLAADEAMSVGCRQSRLAMDGRQIEPPAAA